ncbi:hypothetical protein J4526_05630 [Desulfurococcaceae archaeon MEX13E-LK6-19]|nr:hypothetical protein J4526_05630 [Desulfurococcaceae archaeon MEX13E-LK6-19]
MIKTMLWIVLRTITRFHEALALLIVVILYVSISAAMLSTANYVTMEADYMRKHIVIGEEKTCNMVNGFYTLYNVTVRFGEKNISLLMICLREISVLEDNGVRFRGNPELIGGLNVSIGSMLSREYNINVGDYLDIIYGNGKKMALHVVAIHYSRSQLDLMIISRDCVNKTHSPSTWRIEWCINRTDIFLKTLIGLNNEIKNIVYYLVILFMITAFVSVTISIHKLGLSLGEFIRDMYLQGFTEHNLFSYYILSSFFTGILGWLLGSSLGLVVSQIATFMLRFYGIIVPFRPFLTINDLLFLFFIAFIPSLIAPIVLWRTIWRQHVEEIQSS